MKKMIAFLIFLAAIQPAKSQDSIGTAKDTLDCLLLPININNNRSMPAAKFKAFTCVKVKMQDTSIHVTISSFTAYFGGVNFQNVAMANVSGTSLASIRTLIDRCMPGSTISFDNITVNTKNGVRAIEGGSVTLY